MKKYRVLLAFLLVSFQAFCQSPGYGFLENKVSNIVKEKLPSVVSIHDLDPVFCRHLAVSYKELYVLDHMLNRRKNLMVSLTGQPTIHNPALDANSFLQEDFDRIIAYQSVTLSALQNGKMVKATSNSPKLTRQQMELLKHTDVGTEIQVSIRFKYQNEAVKVFGDGSSVKEGDFRVKVVPHTESAFPGGKDGLTTFFTKQVSARITPSVLTKTTDRAIVSFVVSEEGTVTNPAIITSSKTPKIDQIILDAIRKMPSWKPAVDAKGNRVPQTFRITFGYDGC
jgi:TonB family protein